MAMTAWLAKFSKLNLLVVEGTDLLPVNRERPDQVLFLEHRHDEKRPNADLAEGVAVVLAEIGNRLVIGNKAAVSHITSTYRRVIRRPAGCLGINPAEPKLGQIEFVDKHIDYANGIVLAEF
jgi:hypothetical protein